MNSEKVHLGCGKVRRKGYDNVDPYSGSSGVIKMCAVKYMKQRKYDSIDIVKTFHMIEHLPREPGKKLLYFIGKCLKPGGRLILECPNVRMEMQRFLRGESGGGPIWGQQKYPGDYHQWGYTPEYLQELLESFGMEITHMGPGTDRHAREGGPEYQIRCEAVKP